MRLIDADRLNAVVNETLETLVMLPVFSLQEVHLKTAFQTLTDMINNAPTVDAEPVMRCKDCKHMTEHCDTDGNAPYWTCSEWDAGTDYDGFCHYGERKDDE